MVPGSADMVFLDAVLVIVFDILHDRLLWLFVIVIGNTVYFRFEESEEIFYGSIVMTVFLHGIL